MAADPRRTLTVIRDEFRAAAGASDGYYINVLLDKKPLRNRRGKPSKKVLDLIDAAVIDGREVAMSSDWYCGEDDEPERKCERELFVARRGGSIAFYEVFEEYSLGLCNCLRQVPAIAKAFSLEPKPDEDQLAAMFEWREILVNLAARNEHQVLRAERGKLCKPRGVADDYFQFGPYTLIPPAERADDRAINFFGGEDEESDTRDQVLARLKRLVRAETSILETKCGVLRGSAYAIDWILDQYGKS